MIPRKGDLIIVKGSVNAKYWAPAAVEEYKIFKNLVEVHNEIIDIPEKNYKNMTHISRYDSTSDQNLASSALNYHRKYCDNQEYRRIQKLIRDLKKASKILPSPESAIQEQRYNQTQKPKSYWESTLETGELIFHKTKTFLGFESIEPKIQKGRYSNTGSGRKRSTFKKLMTNVLSLPKNSTNSASDPAEVEIDLQKVPRGGFYQTNRHLRVKKKTKRWQKLEQTIVLILGIMALARSTIISDSHIDEHLVPKDRNKKIVRLQNQMVFENLNLEKISIKNTNDTPNIDGVNFEVNSKTRKILDKSKYHVVKIGDSLIVQERLSIKDQTKIAQMLEEEFNFIPELNETPKANEPKSIVRKKRQQVKKLCDLAPLNFEGTDTINCYSDTNSLKIRIKT